MSLLPATIAIQAWESPGIILEHYTYSTGAVTPLPPHAHPEYQFGISFDCQGEYTYRGQTNPIPVGTLSTIHSGEAHAPSQRTELPSPATFWMMQVDPSMLQTTAAEVMGKPIHTAPYIPQLSLGDQELLRRFLWLCATIATRIDRLEQDLAWLDFATLLIARHADIHPQSTHYPEHRPAVTIARDFLQIHYRENLSLSGLATLAGLSRSHLSRMFHQETELTLSAYQQQLRINQAKKLLTQGLSIAKVATAVGFSDQSHLGRHFKRIVGVTPKEYTKSHNIVLDMPNQDSVVL